MVKIISKIFLFFNIIFLSLTTVLIDGCLGDASGGVVCSPPSNPLLCGVDLSSLETFSPSESPILQGTSKIAIPGFTSDNFNRYDGDSIISSLINVDLEYITCCDISSKAATLTSTPRLKWEYIDNKLIAAGIFNKPIRVSKHSIINKMDLVWIWHSGLGPIVNENNSMIVDYNDGKNVLNGEILDDVKLTPLDSNKLYYWCVWAWNKSGTLIERSSRQLPFLVKPMEKALQLSVDSDLAGTWRLIRIIDDNNADVLKQFPLEVIEFKLTTIDYLGQCKVDIESKFDGVPSSITRDQNNIISSIYSFRNVYLTCSYLSCDLYIGSNHYLANFIKE